ncbi:TIR domain-containing protein [Massilia sp. MB5]|uniref:TIR domain-containing protein n=1 Tax=Massilia sp. MB5 TaxID=2919578 RepID=UPI001F0D348E|nr:TIR domain-containing protein [Massilia sp. MB5]UMR29122.1 TIR domain-containing protein [Massilia sp. MB5]
MLKVKRGSVFDEKCDLIVLPCSSIGTITPWVKSEIEQNNLPFPSANIPFGQVRVLSTEARYAKADFVAYAASVDGRNSSSRLKVIEKIAADLILQCNQNNCSIVNIPLLGTGAGGLDFVEVFDAYKRILGKESFIVNVYAPDKTTYQALLNYEQAEGKQEDVAVEHPRVFISYSWKDDTVKSWVLELAKKLCANGVDARLDRFHLRPGMDLPQWMTNELIKAHKVLLICDSHYAEKADMRKAGVGWETMIIQGDMMLQGDMNTKYIVVAYGDFEKIHLFT